MKKNILYFVLFSVLLLSSCANNGLSGVSSEAIPEAIPEGEFCKHAQYTLKETYSDYQEALADYNMLFDRTTDHQAEDSPCRFHEPSSQKLSRDKRRMQEIINEFERQMPPKELTDQEKLDKIQHTFESMEEILLWFKDNQSSYTYSKNKKEYDRRMDLKEQYNSGKITLNEYYKKFYEK